ncbi:hypothetical protein J437_LFUL003384 [Ladona fulva]|uniref:Uncharacterized protein n=1 Tax=Ladona fulva TaxID=123851 RepID=A0A8K0NW91_LADFU|nr:hypothetical protein J437_LFUL003384 [Ladona fulva]
MGVGDLAPPMDTTSEETTNKDPEPIQDHACNIRVSNFTKLHQGTVTNPVSSRAAMEKSSLYSLDPSEVLVNGILNIRELAKVISKTIGLSDFTLYLMGPLYKSLSVKSMDKTKLQAVTIYFALKGLTTMNIKEEFNTPLKDSLYVFKS